MAALSPEQLAELRRRAGIRIAESATSSPAIATALPPIAASSERARPASAGTRARRSAHPLVHVGDLARARHRQTPPGWLRGHAERTVDKLREPGMPLRITLLAAFGYFMKAWHADGRGFCQRSYDAIAQGARMARSTAQRCLAALEAMGLVAAVNTWRRTWLANGTLHEGYGPNVYAPVVPPGGPTEAPPPPDDLTPPPSWWDQATELFGALLGLRASLTGRGLQRPSEAPPAPA